MSAVAKILSESGNHAADVFTNKLNPIPQRKTEAMRYMIPLLQGGKQAGSAVKFSKFFLIVDPSLATHESIVQTLKIF